MPLSPPPPVRSSTNGRLLFGSLLSLSNDLSQQCFKILPAVVGVILILVVGFAVWVRSVPPALVTPTISPEILEQLKQQFADSNNNKADLKFTAPSDGDGSGKVEKEERTTMKATVKLTPKGDTSAEDDVTEL
jgi:hypothetical protein